MRTILAENISYSAVATELKNGKTLVYPTETCYGLGCDATNAQAVEKIFEIKQRQKSKSLLLLMDDIAMAMHYVEWTVRLQKISEHYWPGALTVVVPLIRQGDLAPGVVAQDNTIAFRITSHDMARSLVKELGRPLVSTSANISAMESPYDSDSVVSMFEFAPAQPDILIDAGVLKVQSPSTIVRLFDGEFEVIRQGEVVVDFTI